MIRDLCASIRIRMTSRISTASDRALTESVKVTKYGHETVHIVSAMTTQETKQAQRDAIEAAELTDAELSWIEAAEIPAEHRYSLDE